MRAGSCWRELSFEVIGLHGDRLNGSKNWLSLGTVVIRLVGTILGKVEVLGLVVGEGGQLDVKLFKVSASNFLIYRLRQDVDTNNDFRI